MAEIDETKTTAEEKPPVVEDKKPDNKAEDDAAKLKTALSRANAEAAEWRRKYTATLNEAQQKEFDAAEAAKKAEEERTAERKELEELKAYKRTNIYKEKLMDAGYDLETANLMANSLPEGVGESYFTAQKAFIQNQRKEAEAAALKNQPGLSVGVPPTGSAKTEEDRKYDRWFGLTS